MASLLTIQANAASDLVVKHALRDATSRISTIALIHAQLAEGASRAGVVDMRAFVRDLALNVQRTCSDATAGVRLSLDLDLVLLPVRLATPCGLLIGELLTNAYQHAFNGSRSGLLEIRLTAQDGTATLVVHDDGPGFPTSQAKGLGLQLIDLLATRQLGGKLDVSRHMGTTFTVRFPCGAREDPPARRTEGTRGGRARCRKPV